MSAAFASKSGSWLATGGASDAAASPAGWSTNQAFGKHENISTEAVAEIKVTLH